MDVAHPASPNYGKHWTPEEVRATFSPSSESVSAVKSWLAASGIDPQRVAETENKGWLAVDLPVHMVESLLGATYHEYEAADDGTVKIGCDE